MKGKIARATLLFSLAGLYVGLTLQAQAQDDHSCSTAKAVGNWGLTLTGTLILPTGPVSGAAVATLSVDQSGNIAGTEARNVGGVFADETICGTWAVTSDCTGTITANIYESGKLVRTSVLNIVFDDKFQEVRMVQKSLTLPSNNSAGGHNA
jgi:hypothetical protein